MRLLTSRCNVIRLTWQRLGRAGAAHPTCWTWRSLSAWLAQAQFLLGDPAAACVCEKCNSYSYLFSECSLANSLYPELYVVLVWSNTVLAPRCVCVCVTLVQQDKSPRSVCGTSAAREHSWFPDYVWLIYIRTVLNPRLFDNNVIDDSLRPWTLSWYNPG